MSVEALQMTETLASRKNNQGHVTEQSRHVTLTLVANSDGAVLGQKGEAVLSFAPHVKARWRVQVGLTAVKQVRFVSSHVFLAYFKKFYWILLNFNVFSR